MTSAQDKAEFKEFARNVIGHEIALTLNGFGGVCIVCEAHRDGNSVGVGEQCKLAAMYFLVMLTDEINAKLKTFVEEHQE